MAKREHGKMETPIATLIDVVFLLIIFFVVTAAVDAEVVDTTIQLAQAKYAKPPEKIDPRTFYINVRENGTVSVGLGQKLTLPELRRLLKSLRNDYGNEYPIVVRADATTPYGKVKLVMDEIGTAGLYKVKLSARKQE